MSVFAYMASHADQLIEATLEHLALLGATMGISCVFCGIRHPRVPAARAPGERRGGASGRRLLDSQHRPVCAAHPVHRAWKYQRGPGHGGLQPVHARPQRPGGGCAEWMPTSSRPPAAWGFSERQGPARCAAPPSPFPPSSPACASPPSPPSASPPSPPPSTPAAWARFCSAACAA